MHESAILAACLSLGLALVAPMAQADEDQAKQLFKAMSDYLGSQATIAFNYDTNLEIVTEDQQKLALASSGAVSLARPDKLRVTRVGGFADIEIVFDGKTLSLLDNNVNSYGQLDAPGSIDNLVDRLRDDYGRPVPGADLLLANVYDELMPLVTDVKDLGSGIIRGVECNHLAFRTADVDWQIWIAVGEQPYPCRYVITSPKVAGFPQYTLEIRDWETGGEAGDFAFTPAADAKKIDVGELTDTDELPAIFKTGGLK
jgi:hypothetical protein